MSILPHLSAGMGPCSVGSAVQPWPAPGASGAVTGAVVVPGSKSVTNRALVLAALAEGSSTLRRPLRSRDTMLMSAALVSLGVDVDDSSDDWTVTPADLRGPAIVDVGLAGTVLRFMPAVATLADGAVGFHGDARSSERPMGPLLDALRAAGAEIDDEERGTLPFVVVGHGGLPGGAISLDASSSSQLVSALLLPAARWNRGVDVTHTGERPVPNAHHLRMTTSMLRDRGVDVDDTAAGRWRISPGAIAARDEEIEPDLSSAAPFLAAAVITGGEATLPHWPAASCQPGAVLPELLEAFGAKCRYADGALVVSGADLRGADLDLRDAGELTPVLAAVAALAPTPTTLRGIAYLRGHETDRLAALARELNGLGGRVTELDDGLRIEPARLRGGVFHTYADHRLAMAAAVVGLVVDGVLIEDIATTTKTFPGFAEAWTAFVSGASH